MTNALAPRAGGPPFAGFASCVADAGVAQPAVAAADYLSRRVALHRTDFAREQGLDSPDKLHHESARIKELVV